MGNSGQPEQRGVVIRNAWQQCRGKTKSGTEAQYINPLKNTQDPVHVTKCGVRVCHHRQIGLLCTGLYTQQFKCVHKCIGVGTRGGGGGGPWSPQS